MKGSLGLNGVFMSPWGANFRNTNLDFFQEYEDGPLAQGTVGFKQLLWLVRPGNYGTAPRALVVCVALLPSLGSGATTKKALESVQDEDIQERWHGGDCRKSFMSNFTKKFLVKHLAYHHGTTTLKNATSAEKPPLQIAGSLLLQGNHRFTTTVLRGEKSSSY